MLPPIKIKLLDRDKDMNLSQIKPVKVKIKEIKNSEQNVSFSHPIKIKICDRDKDMASSYEKRQVKVREKDGKVVVKYKTDILPTDQILEFLSNDYVKPIRIKISTLDLVYNWLYDLLFKFNFASTILAGFAIVVQFGRFITKLVFKSVAYPFEKYFGKPRWVLKFKHSIELALDIFKVEGLIMTLKTKCTMSNLVVLTASSQTPLIFNTPAISETIIYDIYPKTIEELLGATEITDDKLGEFVLGQSRLASGNTIEDIVDGKTISDMMYKKVPRIE